MFYSIPVISAKRWLGVAAVLLGLLPGAAIAQTTDFIYTGKPQQYTVPAGITQLEVVAEGAAGGRVSSIQARSVGAQVRATIMVVPGEVLTVVVGQQGADGNGSASYNGGGGGGGGAGSGGGATDLRRAGLSTGDYLASRNALLVAGGAGGTDWINSPTPQGGSGGAPMGGNGVGLSGNVPGEGATQRTVGGGGGGGSSWVAPAAAVSAPTYDVASDGTVGRLTITPVQVGGPLPVQLVDFTARALAGGVALAWHTASEVNSDKFEIERSLDGATFAKLGTVAAHGTTTQAQAYTYRDAQLPTGATVLYYRLRQVDFGGAATFSPVRSVALPTTAVAFGAEVYPNPWAGELHVRLSGFSPEPVSFVLYDALGQRVRSHTTASAEQLTLPGVADLPSGAYVLHISQGSARQVVKLAH